MFAPTSAIENTSSSSLTIRRKLSSLVSCKFSSRESRHFTPCTRIWRGGTKFLVSCHSAVSPRASALAVWSFRCRNESLCECATSLRFSAHFPIEDFALLQVRHLTPLFYCRGFSCFTIPHPQSVLFCPGVVDFPFEDFPFRRVRHLTPYSM